MDASPREASFVAPPPPADAVPREALSAAAPPPAAPREASSAVPSPVTRKRSLAPDDADDDECCISKVVPAARDAPEGRRPGGGGASSAEKRRRQRPPGRVRVVRGDLLAATEPVLVQQCNCTSKGARGLAKALFDRFPSADVYRQRSRHSTPGTLESRQIAGGRTLVALYAQRAPGLPRRSGDDSAETRLAWFELSLDALAELLDGRGEGAQRSVALPYNVGCGLAGGDWKLYSKTVDAFARDHGVDVTLYDLDGASTKAEKR
ncbi:hypothetical protein M885DRAFT_552176 [Pelagophyceae sp. CCMP2097]|nr:hypothetical protein M885DRAFT_552176 [Pelagophyceae sp. CCMP2097]|mmetsp:Transcript_16663/g.58088  ORF Transcript_16663/g.58088 Transcript_16663/m.58088 type:complete len:264 (-) Transcript_16663:28-819(-)